MAAGEQEPPRLMGVLRPLKLQITNWPGPAEVEELVAPIYPGGPMRRLPFGREIFIEHADFFLGEKLPNNYRRLAVGKAVKLRYAYVVTCESCSADEEGEVSEVFCSLDVATKSRFDASSGSTSGRLPPGTGVIHWVHSSQHALVPCDLSDEGVMRCEPAVLEAMAGTLPGCEGPFQLERLGNFAAEGSGGERRLRCLSSRAAWAERPDARPRWSALREEVLEVVAPGAMPEGVEEPLLLLSASERWAGLIELDLHTAWCEDLGLEAECLRRVAPGLYSAQGVQAGDLAHRLSQLTGLRRCLQLLCPAKGRPEDLVQDARRRSLSFQEGFSLEVEAPYSTRHEATAPYSASSAFLPAAVAREVQGPLEEAPAIPQDDTEGAERDAGAKAGSARLVLLTLPTAEPLSLFAQDLLPLGGMGPTFVRRWKKRPYPDYSAALEPLAALALVNLGRRVHRARHGEEVVAFLDPSCGTGAVSAAARHCGVGRAFFAGDISRTMVKRTAANLEMMFPASVQQESGPAPEGAPSMFVRHWDAGERWPLPPSAGVSEDGKGLLVVANLPWGLSLSNQKEDAGHIARCLAREFPQATLCFIAPRALAEGCDSWFSIDHQVPAGKKAVVLVGRGMAA